jgi:hypothetical protein
MVDEKSVMIRSMSRTTTAVTTTTNTGASRVRPKTRSSGVTIGTGTDVVMSREYVTARIGKWAGDLSANGSSKAKYCGEIGSPSS